MKDIRGPEPPAVHVEWCYGVDAITLILGVIDDYATGRGARRRYYGPLLFPNPGRERPNRPRIDRRGIARHVCDGPLPQKLRCGGAGALRCLSGALSRRAGDCG